MREIKFRAWDKETGTMSVSGHLWLDNPPHEFTKKFELMQFTGLKGKNGKEIYEGDIVRHKHKCSQCENKFIDAVVEWNGDGWWLKQITDTPHRIYDEMGMIFPWEKREVIGNIYQNPELLK